MRYEQIDVCVVITLTMDEIIADSRLEEAKYTISKACRGFNDAVVLYLDAFGLGFNPQNLHDLFSEILKHTLDRTNRDALLDIVLASESGLIHSIFEPVQSSLLAECDLASRPVTFTKITAGSRAEVKPRLDVIIKRLNFELQLVRVRDKIALLTHLGFFIVVLLLAFVLWRIILPAFSPVNVVPFLTITVAGVAAFALPIFFVIKAYKSNFAYHEKILKEHSEFKTHPGY